MERIEGALALMIPIVAIVFGIGVAFWSIYWDHQKKRLQYQERQLMIEKGLVPPPDLVDGRRRVTPEDCLRRGTVLLSLGVGLAIGAVILANVGRDNLVWLPGLAAAIVGSLGVGNLAYYRTSRHRAAEPMKPDTSAM